MLTMKGEGCYGCSRIPPPTIPLKGRGGEEIKVLAALLAISAFIFPNYYFP